MAASPSKSASQKIPDLERRLAADPASLLFLSLAEAYRRTDRLEDAERVLRAGLDRHPQHHTARVGLGRVLSRQGNHQEAREVLARVVQEVPDNLLAQRLLEELDAAPPGAPRVERAASAYGPGSPEGRTTLPADEPLPGELPRDRRPTAPGRDAGSPPAGKQVDTAAADASREMQEPPSPSPTEELSGPTLAELYVAQGEPEKALEIFRELQEREPGNPEWAGRIRSLEAGAGEPATPTAEEGPSDEDHGDLFAVGSAAPEPLPDDVWEVEPEPVEDDSRAVAASATLPLMPGMTPFPAPEPFDDEEPEVTTPAPQEPVGAEDSAPVGGRERRLRALGRYLDQVQRHGRDHAR